MAARGGPGQHPVLLPEVSGYTAESNVSMASGNDDGLPTAFGAMRTKMLAQVQQIQEAQVKLFREHMNLESHPSHGLDMQGEVDESTRDEEAGGEGRYKPQDLENWFDQKERKIAQLTTHLKEVCKEMAELNQTAREGISAREA
eukprot:CAMPEP_0177697544 /NCGR_PEP_ID=MMETSP0484_2-20121128/4569_1 /TAXON_ID=354590 /ORGANISM="Rhodomonas lens, Strain RHODO" /LENGTH=143 /DNA_ID=CAMNT_0019208587 /DNA_START=150 /DNA_END=578 /DNA_ORIENTATION=-